MEQSIHIYETLKQHGVPAELHIFQNGGHGFTLEEDRGDAVTSTVRGWSERCCEWLELRGIVQPQK